MELDVKGHSGCSIEVRREGGELYVVKSTCDKSYLERLAKQAQKQSRAELRQYRHIKVPAVHSVERDDCRTVVKMDYVYSRNFIEYFEQSGFEQIDYLSRALIDFIEKEIAESRVTTVPSTVIQSKFENVKCKMTCNRLLARDNEVVALMERSGDVFAKCGDWSLPVGTCHGDLTFSNILFSGSSYYLIDFLDSFIESPMMDIVKLRQDTAYGWSQLMYTKRYDRVRLRIIMEKIDEAIERHFSRKYEWYSATYRPLQLMNFLRVLQYANEPKVVDYLKRTISDLLQ